jgi:hypothetical protein
MHSMVQNGSDGSGLCDTLREEQKLTPAGSEADAHRSRPV